MRRFIQITMTDEVAKRSNAYPRIGIAIDTIDTLSTDSTLGCAVIRQKDGTAIPTIHTFDEIWEQLRP